MQILNTMLYVMNSASNIETSKDDIMLVQRAETKNKYEIEKSLQYIRYKLFWIMKIFLEGKIFTCGFLPLERHRIHVFDILKFVPKSLSSVMNAAF